MGAITGYNRRTAFIGAGGAGGVLFNIYTADSTFTDAIRSGYLLGNSASDELRFRSLGGFPLINMRGDSRLALLTDTYTSSDISIGDPVVSGWKSASIYVAGTLGWTFYSEYAASQNRKTLELGGLGLGRIFGYYNTNSSELAGYIDPNVGTFYFGSANTTTPVAYFNGGGNVGKITFAGQGMELKMYDRNFSSVNPVVYFASQTGGSCFIIRRNLGLGTNAPNASAILDLVSTGQGFGLPSMTTVQKLAIATPRVGLVVFDTTLGQISYYNGAWVNL